MSGRLLTDDIRFVRLREVTERMRQQVCDAGSTSRVHEEDILEAARLVRWLADFDEVESADPDEGSCSGVSG